MMVYECLSKGKENAIPGKDLAALLKLKDLRELTQIIERERKDGHPICASTDTTSPGYYLADGPAELWEYIKSLGRRLHNIGVTRKHLEDTLDRMTGQERVRGW